MTEIDDNEVVEITSNLASAARALFRAGTVTDTLRSVVDLAVESIEGCDHAAIYDSVELSEAVPVASDQIGAQLSVIERRVGQGPCTDALASRSARFSREIAGDARWPDFAAAAAALEIRGVLALLLEGDGALGALGLYSRVPSAFDIEARAQAVIFVTIAGLAINAARAHEDDDRRLEELHQALSTRELIGQAQGILMERERITAAQAFDILRVASQHLNIKLREVARDLVETGEDPSARDRPLS